MEALCRRVRKLSVASSNVIQVKNTSLMLNYNLDGEIRLDGGRHLTNIKFGDMANKVVMA